MILIDGGTGFVGNWMRRTQPENVRATYIGRKEYELGIWKRLSFSTIVHLAPIDPSEVIDYCKIWKSRLLYCSSGAAYDLQTEYANNKRMWEKQCLESGVEVVIARLFTFFGEGLDNGKAIVQFENLAKANQDIIITGTGKAVRTYMSGEKMAQWMWAVLEHGANCEIYDIGSDTKITIGKLAMLIVKEYESTSKIIIEGGIDPVPYYVPKNTAKTRKLLWK